VNQDVSKDLNRSMAKRKKEIDKLNISGARKISFQVKNRRLKHKKKSSHLRTSFIKQSIQKAPVYNRKPSRM